MNLAETNATTASSYIVLLFYIVGFIIFYGSIVLIVYFVVKRMLKKIVKEIVREVLMEIEEEKKNK